MEDILIKQAKRDYERKLLELKKSRHDRVLEYQRRKYKSAYEEKMMRANNLQAQRNGIVNEQTKLRTKVKLTEHDAEKILERARHTGEWNIVPKKLSTALTLEEDNFIWPPKKPKDDNPILKSPLSKSSPRVVTTNTVPIDDNEFIQRRLKEIHHSPRWIRGKYETYDDPTEYYKSR